MKKLYTIFLVILLLSSCASSLYTGNGAIHNASFSTDEFDVDDISITETGSSYFGVPINNKKHQNTSGFTFNFNGVTITKIPAIIPALTLGMLTVQSALFMDEVTKKNNRNNRKNGAGIDNVMMGFPIAATLNSLIWKGSSKGAAGSQINTRMLIENNEVDMFLFPKYNTQTQGFFFENSTVNMRVKGATLK